MVNMISGVTVVAVAHVATTVVHSLDVVPCSGQDEKPSKGAAEQASAEGEGGNGLNVWNGSFTLLDNREGLKGTNSLRQSGFYEDLHFRFLFSLSLSLSCESALPDATDEKRKQS